MSAFCSKYPGCGCVDVGTKCHDIEIILGGRNSGKSKLVSQCEADKPVTYLPKQPRNQPCPCGSGKKYKHCCTQ